jgi:hypothetical protein
MLPDAILARRVDQIRQAGTNRNPIVADTNNFLANMER